MTALELLTMLHTLDVVLSPTCDYADVVPGNPPSTDDRPLVFGVHVKAPLGVLTDALRLAIRTHKAELIELVELYEERAALAEYCGRVPQAEAEALAWQFLCDHKAVEVFYG